MLMPYNLYLTFVCSIAMYIKILNYKCSVKQKIKFIKIIVPNSEQRIKSNPILCLNEENYKENEYEYEFVSMCTSYIGRRSFIIIIILHRIIILL